MLASEIHFSFQAAFFAMKLFSFLSLRQWLTLPYIALVFSVAVLIGTLSYRTGSQAVDTIANHLLLDRKSVV